MKTERQMFEDYIATQEARLTKLIQEKANIEKDIDNVKELLLRCPYDKAE